MTIEQIRANTAIAKLRLALGMPPSKTLEATPAPAPAPAPAPKPAPASAPAPAPAAPEGDQSYKLVVEYTEASEYTKEDVVRKYSEAVWKKLMRRARSIAGSDGIPGIKVPDIKTLNVDTAHSILMASKAQGDELTKLNKSGEPNFSKYPYIRIFRNQIETVENSTKNPKKTVNLGKVLGSYSQISDNSLLEVAVGY